MAGMGHNQKPQVSITALTDAQKKELKLAVTQLNDSLTRQAAEKDHQKAVIDAISDKTGVEKKIVRRMAKVYYKSNYDEEQEANRSFEEFYDGVMK